MDITTQAVHNVRARMAQRGEDPGVAYDGDTLADLGDDDLAFWNEVDKEVERLRAEEQGEGPEPSPKGRPG